LKTKDTKSVRRIIKRILDELVQYKFIKDYAEEKLDMKYVYRYTRTPGRRLRGKKRNRKLI
jgi:hypothetical protein